MNMNKKMKVLFISSGNNKNGISPIIFNQGESLKKHGIEVDYYVIKGKGLFGYLKNIPKIRKLIKNKNYDLIHAHYSLAGWIALLSKLPKKIPLVLSLMGTDAQGEYIGKNKVRFSSYLIVILTLIIQPFVNIIICKSKNIESIVFIKKKSFIIPNGVNLDEFKPVSSRNSLRIKLGFKPDLKYVLFLGNKNNKTKNYNLALNSINLINKNKNNIVLLNPYPLNHNEVPKYLNAVDILVHCSYAEGSPNVIKEAMACNCPIVSTDVGDIRWIIGNTEGCYIADFSPEDFSKKIILALEYAEKKGRTNGRDRILELGLDTDSIAKKIIDIYKKALL